MALELDVMNDELMKTWLNRKTKLSDRDKHILISIKEQVQGDIYLFYELNKLAFREIGIVDNKQYNIYAECQKHKVVLRSLYGNLKLNVNEFRKIVGTFIEIYEPVYPMGTVVELKKEYFKGVINIDEIKELKAVVAHRYVPVSDKRYMPYVGLIYPFGPMGIPNDALHFTPAAVKRVVHRGYTDEKEDAYIYLVKSKAIVDLDMHSNAFMTKEEYIKIINRN